MTEVKRCDARIRPFRPKNDVEVVCERPEHVPYMDHQGTIRDYAYPGSKTVLTWYWDDRRSFDGLWPGACEANACPLPRGHHGAHV